MDNLLIIKLGGSVVTYKDSPIPKARISTIKNLAKEIKQLSEQGYKLILVHGAGSFAHGLVKKYDLHHGMRNKKQEHAFKKVIKSMLRLNQIISKEFIKLNLSVETLSPHTFISQNAGNLKSFDLKDIRKLFKNNKIPLLYGDMVLDSAWGCSVLSGDTIVCYLGNKLKADKVIFLSDVDGIYDQDPRKNPKAKLISEINNHNLDQVLKGLSSTGREDVTGEMKGKILQIQQSLRQVPIILLNGLKEKQIAQAVSSTVNLVGTKLFLY